MLLNASLLRLIEQIFRRAPGQSHDGQSRILIRIADERGAIGDKKIFHIVRLIERIQDGSFGIASHAGNAEVNAILGPTQNFVPGRGLRFAMAFDDQPPQTIDILEHNTNRDWEETVKDSVRYAKANFALAQPGQHTLKIWMVDPGIVLEKLVVDVGGLKPSYLGPPENVR